MDKGQRPVGMGMEQLEGRRLMSGTPVLEGTITRAFVAPQMHPGGTGSVIVTVHNSGDVALRAPYFIDVFSTPGRAFTFTSWSELLGGVRVSKPIVPGGTMLLNIPFEIPSNAQVGQYHLTVCLNRAKGEYPTLASPRATFSITPLPGATLAMTASRRDDKVWD